MNREKHISATARLQLHTSDKTATHPPEDEWMNSSYLCYVLSGTAQYAYYCIIHFAYYCIIQLGQSISASHSVMVEADKSSSGAIIIFTRRLLHDKAILVGQLPACTVTRWLPTSSIDLPQGQPMTVCNGCCNGSTTHALLLSISVANRCTAGAVSRVVTVNNAMQQCSGQSSAADS